MREKQVCKKQKIRFIYLLGFILSQAVSAGVTSSFVADEPKVTELRFRLKRERDDVWKSSLLRERILF